MLYTKGVEEGTPGVFAEYEPLFSGARAEELRAARYAAAQALVRTVTSQ